MFSSHKCTDTHELKEPQLCPNCGVDFSQNMNLEAQNIKNHKGKSQR